MRAFGLIGAFQGPVKVPLHYLHGMDPRLRGGDDTRSAPGHSRASGNPSLRRIAATDFDRALGAFELVLTKGAFYPIIWKARFGHVCYGADPSLQVRLPGSPNPHEQLRPGEVEPCRLSSDSPLHVVSLVVGVRLRGRSNEHQVRQNGSLRPHVPAGARRAPTGTWGLVRIAALATLRGVQGPVNPRNC